MITYPNQGRVRSRYDGCAPDFYQQDTGLKYPTLKDGDIKIRRIAGISVVQRHDWTNIRYREIRASIECRPLNYGRCGRQLDLGV